MASKFQFITELYNQTLQSVTSSYENWTDFLRAASYNYKCPFDEQILIYAQRPDATAVLEIERWNTKFHRWINKGAKGIAVFSDDKDKLKHYFDVSDTHETTYSRPLPIWKLEGAYEGVVIEALENTFGTLSNKESLSSAIISASHNVVVDNLPNYLFDLKNCLDDSFLEELDELNVEVRYRQCLENSVAYMLMTRLDLDAEDYFEREDFSFIHDFNTLPTINALGIATSDIAEMGLREIARTVIQSNKQRFLAKQEEINENGRSFKHGSDLQERGRLSDSEPAAATGAGGDAGQIRRAEEELPQGVPQSDLYHPQNHLQANGTLSRGGEAGAADDFTDGYADGERRGRDGGTESYRPDEMDGAYEQPSALGGRDSLSGSDLQINSFETGGENELPAFLNEKLMEAIILDEGGRSVKRQKIFEYFQSHKDYAERCEFLKNAYTDTYVEIFADGERVGYKKQENGLLMWSGAYLSRTSESVFSWGVVTELTDNLMQRGEYKIKLGQQALPTVTEQLTLFGMVEEAPSYEAPAQESFFPKREVPREVIDKALYTASNASGSVCRVIAHYMRAYPETDNIAFLKREFGVENGRGIEHESRKYAVWFTDDGIQLAEGNSVRTGANRNIVSWAECSKRILELLNEGRYASQAELENAYETALHECADSLVLTARDISEEGKKQGFFQKTLEIYRQSPGFPECAGNLTAYMGTDEGILEISQEYHVFLAAYEENKYISRFCVSPYNTHRIGFVLDGIKYPKREFTAEEGFMRSCKMFITQDELDSYFCGGSWDGKLSTYSYFCNFNTAKERQAAVKKEYGVYSGSCGGGYSTTRSSKGLTYERSYGRKQYDSVQLTFPQIVKTYERLIAQKRFPGEDALAKIPEYEVEQLARQVYHSFYNAPQEIPRPYPVAADFYAAIPIIREQLKEMAKVQEMLSNLSSLVDITATDDRYFKSRVEGKEALTKYVNGTYDLFSGKHREHAKKLERTDENSISSETEPETLKEIIQEEEKLAPAVMLRKTAAPVLAPVDRSGSNFSITDDALGVGTPKEKFARNIEAIKVLQAIESESRTVTSEEQQILSQYVGWGGLADAFDSSKAAWSEEYGTLKNLLSDSEYAAARESTLTAFYTPPVIIKSIYQAISNMGFIEGNICDPACGTGNFLGLLPESMKQSQLYGVELDSVSGRIARQLYPTAAIAVQGFEKTDFSDNFFDVMVGNVPFGQFKVPDKRYDKHNFSIHDYFFARSLDKVRPGGVIAFITSSFTMDKKNSSVRKYIAQRADLLGAIRLPNNTFKANAGTEVTSDILFLQKRDRIVDIEPDWVHLGTDNNGIVINQYFIDHPDMIMGEMKEISGPFGPEPACIAYEGQNLSVMLNDAIKNIHAEIVDYDRADELDNEVKSIPADPTVKNFSYTLVDDVIFYRVNSRMIPVEVSVTAANRIRGMIALRDCMRTLIEYQTEDYSEEGIKAQQARLNILYDDFTAKYGLINSRGNEMAFSEDSSYFLLCSLEIVDEDGNLLRKADFFTKRTIRAHKPVEKVGTASEALAVSIGERAIVDMEYMGKLTGKSEIELYNDLQGVLFLNPLYEDGNSREEKYLTADEYLSGNVRQKLALAMQKAEIDAEAFSNHVEALTAVQPVDLTASEINVRLGATWLNPEYVRQFTFELLGTSRYAQYGIKVYYSKITGEWRIEGKTKDSSNIKAFNTYGTQRISAYHIIEESLNLKDVRIFDYSYDADGKRVTTLNKKETAIAQSKQELIKAQFSEWIWKDPDRREKICKAYNLLFNSTRPREYDGSHIVLSGMNPEIRLREHQLNAVAHILYGGNTLLAHTVGAGKTYEMVAASMESKRLGLCQKSLFVVPNHLTEQWASEFLQLYPAANILVATKKDFETKNRKKFCGRIATGEYDAVIIGHSQFEKIPMSVERQQAILQQQMDEILMGIDEAKRSNAENFTIKQMEKTRKSLEQKMEKLNDQSRKDDIVTFEELGVDRLFIDESHFYKNLFLYTKMRNVGGIAQTEAQKSSDLFMKCRYIDELTGGRGIVFATGTPISNSMVEMYTIQRYLQYDTLLKHGLQHFDSWAANFGETVTAIELSPEGTGYRAKTRFAKFYNLPELMAMFKDVADIKTADMLNLPVPKANYHNIAVKPSEYQKKMVASLSERADRARNREVDSSVDNMLLITNDGRKLALDQRLISPMLPDDENSKAAICAENVFKIWQRTTSKSSAQMIFCDLSIPHYDGSFNVYDDIKQKLIAKGIPNEEIAFIHDAKTDVQKKELFNKVRLGQVRVLMGSTQRMGAGTNAQNKLIALHHCDCPWRPSDLQQREGRIIRQGNENPEVDIYSYVTEQTFDAYLYQLVESKQKFISQIMTSKSPVRSAEDVDETALSYAEIKALATGNPMIKEKMQLDTDVAKLKMLKASHLSQRYALEDRIIKSFPKEIADAKERISGYAIDKNTIMENTYPNEDGFSPMVLLGKTYSDKKAAGSALLSICQNMLTPESSEIGLYRGLRLELAFDSFAQEYRLTMVGKLRYTMSLGTDVFGNIQRMDNSLEALPVKEQSCKELLAEIENQLNTAKLEVQKPFIKEAELSEKLARIEELNALLNMDDQSNECRSSAEEGDYEDEEYEPE